MADSIVAMFELSPEGTEIKVADEKHYKLVPADQLDQEAVRNYRP